MDDKVEEINTDEVSLVETEGAKRRPGSFIPELQILDVRHSMKIFPLTSFTRNKPEIINWGAW